MNRVELLEKRLAEVGQVLAASNQGLALLGLGSVGVERSRLDQWSDLDFFAIVRPGTKAAWIDDPAWLDRAHPVAYRFRNTVDGFKLLWADGVFAEMAVFEPQELAAIPYAEPRVVWAHPDFDQALAKPQRSGLSTNPPPSIEWSIGELLTCLYVGLCRFHRGERLSAWRFIQSYCLDRFLEVIESSVPPRPGCKDPYTKDRRFETLYPEASLWLKRFETGIERIPQAALAFLEWAETQAPVNPAMKAEIVRLARG
jgi:hypothetical protein